MRTHFFSYGKETSLVSWQLIQQEDCQFSGPKGLHEKLVITEKRASPFRLVVALGNTMEEGSPSPREAQAFQLDWLAEGNGEEN
jgi:hypothetical protein